MLAEKYKIKSPKRRNIFMLIFSTICLLTVFSMFVYDFYIIPAQEYGQALQFMRQEKYKQAIAIFEEMDHYKDSQKKLVECKYGRAVYLLKCERFEEAYEMFDQIKDFKDSRNFYIYSQALKFYFEREYDSAKALFKQVEGFQSSKEYLTRIEKIYNLNGNWSPLSDDTVVFKIHRGIIDVLSGNHVMSTHYLEYKPDSDTYFLLIYPSYWYETTSINLDSQDSFVLKSIMNIFVEGVYVRKKDI